MTRDETFAAVRIGIQSPEQILARSSGEVTRPDTLNYRTLVPHPDGLFSQRIFGPVVSWCCACERYKRQRYAGVVCEKCGVEVTRKEVRRERMAHISLASPVAHIWFVRGTPSSIGTLLDVTGRDLENVVYFARWMITSVNEQHRDRLARQIEEDHRLALEALEGEAREILDGLGSEERSAAEAKISERRQTLLATADQRRKDLATVRPTLVLADDKKIELEQRYPGLFRALMGAEAVLEVLGRVDLEALEAALVIEMTDLPATSGKRKKLSRRLRMVRAMRQSALQPSWMILTVLPVLPPDLRPMVQLDGGRFASSDINDLYRRVINRNNRLKRLLELRAPEIIIRNERRMLQEAVDSLLDNGRRGLRVTDNTGHPMKSLADMLKGKRGRFRMNLLGKRVDYSGRSVIVVGPHLKLRQCGLPKTMALELFKPFVMGALVQRGAVETVKAAKKLIEAQDPVVWEVLSEVVRGRPVLLNRAPTLHRLGIQAFEPVIVEGNAIQLHPLTCKAFNADFDGDQMAVHVPLSQKAVDEAYKRMLSIENIFSPSDGHPIAAPTLEMVMGAYWLTTRWDGSIGAGKAFASPDEARTALETGHVHVQAPVKIRFADGTWRDTTVGRMLFNAVLPAGHPYIESEMGSKDISALVRAVGDRYSNVVCGELLDGLKELTLWAATRSGATISIGDIVIPADKPAILGRAEAKVAEIAAEAGAGRIDEATRSQRSIDAWNAALAEISESVMTALDPRSAVSWMARSGARGNVVQYRNLAGMRGLMVSPTGEIIETPIKSNLREGHSVLEYFISTHGSRKGQADTSLKTADSGYLTRRLVDVAQDVIIRDHDCGTTQGRAVVVTGNPLLRDAVYGRFLAEDARAADGRVILRAGDEILQEGLAALTESTVARVVVRSSLSCALPYGLCQVCYGRDLSRNRLIELGEAVGVVAAQSIGEPGTQLTLRTFHTGGVAGTSDITQGGLGRVEEIFEARTPKIPAILAVEGGVVRLGENADGVRGVEITSPSAVEHLGPLPKKVKVTDGDRLVKGALWATSQRAPVTGTFRVNGDTALIETDPAVRTYLVHPNAKILVRDHETVETGAALTNGYADPQEILALRGENALCEYLIGEVQCVYAEHARIHDKHIEVIVRQMLRWVAISNAGDTGLLPGDLVDRGRLEQRNAEVLAKGGEPATARPVLLGITKASLGTDSFLSAASFQTTTQVLTNAAVHSAIDRLRGLKENVILARLIPAGSGYDPEVDEETKATESLADIFGAEVSEG